MRRSILLFLLPLLPACTSWQPVALPVPEAAEWSVTGRLRATTHWGTRIHGDSAWIAGDTLRIRAVAESTASVTISQIALLERHGFDGGRTTGLGLGIAALSVFMVLIGNMVEDSISTGLGGMTWAGAP